MKPSPQYIVYILGVAGLGLFYVPIKSALGGQWLFLISAIAYLLALRFLGAWVAKQFASGERSNDA
jgi:hypothetical protein